MSALPFWLWEKLPSTQIAFHGCVSNCLSESVLQLEYIEYA